MTHFLCPLRYLILLLVTLHFLVTSGFAQPVDLPVTLVADKVVYDPDAGTLSAEGNVEVFYQGNRLEAHRLRYSEKTGLLTAEGPIRMETSGGTVILADLTELSPDFANGLIQGARLLINQQLQLAAAEGHRVDGRFTTLDKIVASSCQVCAEHRTPTWQIRAGRVVHDDLKKQIYFENAWFDLYGVPIGYFPYLRIPDPSIGRSSGFLLPRVSTSELWGYGVKVPYYLTLGDHADATITPFVTTGGTSILEGEYRQNFASGQIRAEGAFSIADGDLDADSGGGNGFGRGYLKANGAFDLPQDFQTSFTLDVTTDNAFLKQFDYSNADRLSSQLLFQRFRKHDYLDLNFSGYQSLRDDEVQDQIPFILPQLEFRRVFTNTPIGGRFGVEGEFLNLRRRAGRDVMRAGGRVNWEGSRLMSNGMQFSGFADTSFDYYSVMNDPTFGDTINARLTPTIGAEVRWAFAKQANNAMHVIEPIAQLYYTHEPDNEQIPNEDSLLPELDETNLFLSNRFPGRDEYEDGLRANIGLNYTRYDPSGWNAGLTIGQVIRARASDEFSSGSGLADTRSDLVVSGMLEFPNLQLSGRTLLDGDFKFRRQDLDVFYSNDLFELGGSYVFLAADDSNSIIGTVPKREELELSAKYRINDNWEIGGDWRQDLAADRPVKGSALLSYGNECIKLDLSVSRRFTTSDNVPEDINFGLAVKFAGLGGDANDSWPSDRCSRNWLQ